MDWEKLDEKMYGLGFQRHASNVEVYTIETRLFYLEISAQYAHVMSEKEIVGMLINKAFNAGTRTVHGESVRYVAVNKEEMDIRGEEVIFRDADEGKEDSDVDEPDYDIWEDALGGLFND